MGIETHFDHTGVVGSDGEYGADDIVLRVELIG